MPTTFGSDTFTDTANTLLTAHTPNVGAGWTVESGVSAAISDANRLRGQTAAGAGESLFTKGDTPDTPEYTVKATLRFLSSFVNGEYGVMARKQAGASTYYIAHYAINAARWEFWRVVGGTWETMFGSFAMAFPTGTDHTVELRCNNASKEMWIDGVQRATTTDNTISGAGKAGIRFHNGGANFSGNATGVHIDDFEAIGVWESGQVILPNATLDAGSWTVTGAATHHAALADENPASYVQSPASPTGQTLKLGLGDFTPGPGDIVIEIDAEQVP